jgi:dTDP-4-dehydrorhamnose reductase
MKILLFGKTGQVAKELCNRPNVTAIGRDKADFTEPQKIIEIVKSTGCRYHNKCSGIYFC